MNTFGAAYLFAVPTLMPQSANGVPDVSASSIAANANVDESFPDATGIA